MTKQTRRLPLFEPERLAYLLETDSLAAWLLQHEYVEWRRSQGLAPPRPQPPEAEVGDSTGSE